MTPENGWLEDVVSSCGPAYFQGRTVSPRECNWAGWWALATRVLLDDLRLAFYTFAQVPEKDDKVPWRWNYSMHLLIEANGWKLQLGGCRWKYCRQPVNHPQQKQRSYKMYDYLILAILSLYIWVCIGLPCSTFVAKKHCTRMTIKYLVRWHDEPSLHYTFKEKHERSVAISLKTVWCE